MYIILSLYFDDRIPIEDKRRMVRKLQEQVEDSRDEKIETQKKLLLKPDELINFINRDLTTDL